MLALLSVFVRRLWLVCVRALRCDEEFGQWLAFLQSHGGYRNECSSDVLNGRFLVYFLTFAVVVPNQILDHARNHAPMATTHMHRGWYLDRAADGVTTMGHDIHFLSARARRQASVVLERSEKRQNKRLKELWL